MDILAYFKHFALFASIRKVGFGFCSQCYRCGLFLCWSVFLFKSTLGLSCLTIWILNIMGVYQLHPRRWWPFVFWWKNALSETPSNKLPFLRWFCSGGYSTEAGKPWGFCQLLPSGGRAIPYLWYGAESSLGQCLGKTYVLACFCITYKWDFYCWGLKMDMWNVGQIWVFWTCASSCEDAAAALNWCVQTRMFLVIGSSRSWQCLSGYSSAGIET